MVMGASQQVVSEQVVLETDIIIILLGQKTETIYCLLRQVCLQLKFLDVRYVMVLIFSNEIIMQDICDMLQ